MPAIALKLPVDTTDPAFASATVLNASLPVVVEAPLRESRVLIVGSMPVRRFMNGCHSVSFNSTQCLAACGGGGASEGEQSADYGVYAGKKT